MVDFIRDPTGVQSIDVSTARRVLGNFVTGITVVTTVHGNRAVGRTVNSFTSVSLDPALVLVCLHRDSAILAQISESGVFAVNMLAADQEGVSSAFRSKDAAQFSGLDHTPGLLGAPVISSALAFVECELHRELDGGDHTILLGRVEDLGVLREGDLPLAFFRGAVGAGAPRPLSPGGV